MAENSLTAQLTFVSEHRQQDEASVLAQAVRTGLLALYRETLIEAYLLGQVSRETVLEELGPEQLEAVEYQRDAIQRDVAWGLRHE